MVQNGYPTLDRRRIQTADARRRGIEPDVLRNYEMSAPSHNACCPPISPIASRQPMIPAALEAAGTRLLSVVADHLRRVESRETKVLNWNQPDKLIQEARQFLTAGERGSPRGHDNAEITARVAEIASATLARGQNLHSPHYVGHQVPAPVPLAAPVRFPRQRHEPGDGDLRNGTLGDRRRTRGRRRRRRTAWLSAGQVFWPDHVRRHAGQPHRAC